MNFLNLSLLGGALALAIPIIIHLFHKSRFVVVKWGAMHLLESVIRVNQRRIRLEQLILLLVRAALPIFLALAMARPVWKGAQKLLGEAKTSTVVVLDNSYSMQASRAGQSNFAIACDQTQRILNELKRGSEAQVVLMGQGGAGVVDTPTYDLARLSQAVGKLDAGYGAATVPAALGFASEVFQKMHESSRNLVVITDFQRVSFQAVEDQGVGQMLDRLRQLPVPLSITFFEAGQEVKDNVAVDGLSFSKLMVGVGQAVQIRANLRNYGDANYPDLRVYFRVDGREKSASQIALAPHASGQVLFSHAFDAAGSHVVEVFADADPLKVDNSYFASIPVRDKVPVLLVNGAPSSEPLKGETDFAEIALQPYSAARVELADLISTKTIRPDEITAQALSATSVVILGNVRKLEDKQLHALQDFVQKGGGLMIFPGDRVDPVWYNGPMYQDGKGLLPLALGQKAGDLKEGATTTSVVGQRFENPALEIFNDNRNGSLTEAAIKQWYRFKDAAAGAAKPPETLARLDAGDPFLVEKAYGEGRVIACATSLAAEWSNLPTRGSYLPLLQRLSIYLASTIYPPRNLDVGSQIVAFLPPGDAGKKAQLVSPDGMKHDLVVGKKGDRGEIDFGETQRPGLYTLTPPDGKLLHYVINASRIESDLQRLTPQEITDFAKAHNVAVVHSASELQQMDHAQRYGREFWKGALWLLLILCFLELFLQQHFARPRRAAVSL